MAKNVNASLKNGNVLGAIGFVASGIVTTALMLNFFVVKNNTNSIARLDAKAANVNYSLNFLNYSDYLSVPIAQGSGLNLGTTNFTIEAWVKTAMTRYGTVVTKGGTSDGVAGYWLYTNPLKGEIRLTIGDGSTRAYATVITKPFNNNVWRHVAVSVDRSKGATFYVNGDNVGFSSLSGFKGKSINSSRPLQVSFNNSSYSWIGQIDELRIWTVARSESEIRQNMYSEIVDPTLFDTTLRAYYRMNENAPGNVYDSTNHANHATIYGNVSWKEGFGFERTSVSQ